MQDTVTGQSQPIQTGPVFLVGSPDSGSAALRCALDRHPHLAIAAETGFLRAVVAHEWIPFWKFGGLWYGRLGLSQEELYEHLRGFYGRMFTRFAQLQGKRRWGDETPFHAWHLLRAARLFPDATFVATVRHPAAVDAARRQHEDYRPKHSARVWTQTNLELVRRAQELGGRFLLCRHEDLIGDPEGALRELLDRLGEPWSPEVLLTAAPESTPTLTMPGTGRTRLHRRTTALASFFGYDMQDPSRLEPLAGEVSAGRFVLTGDDLARRADGADAVDWRVRPRPPASDRRLDPKRVTVVASAEQPPARWSAPPQPPVSGAATNVAARGGPIFLVGSMGSGTTLIRLVLDSHERIAIAPETGFMRAATANRSIPFWRPGSDWYQRLGVSDEELDAELRRLYGGIFERFAQQHGKSRWGDKTPYHTWYMIEAARIFPDAVFIGMVRHPGGAASSLHNRFSRKFLWPHAVDNWQRLNMGLVERAAALGDRFLLCRYENLVLEPEPTMRELLAWLDEPWSPNVLAHHVVHGDRPAPTVVEGRTRTTDPIDVARVSRWAESLDPEVEQLLREKTAALAGFFGYHLDDATRLDPLVPAGSSRRHVVTGTELARRRDGFRNDVDWSRRPELRFIDRTLDPRWLTAAPVKAPATSKAPEAVEAPMASKAAKAPEAVEAPMASKAAKAPEAVEAPKIVKAPNAVKAPAARLRGLAARARAAAHRRMVSRGP